jgi:hypothetical protein
MPFDLLAMIKEFPWRTTSLLKKERVKQLSAQLLTKLTQAQRVQLLAKFAQQSKAKIRQRLLSFFLSLKSFFKSLRSQEL